jgi:hypothetical protein
MNRQLSEQVGHDRAVMRVFLRGFGGLLYACKAL